MSLGSASPADAGAFVAASVAGAAPAVGVPGGASVTVKSDLPGVGEFLEGERARESARSLARFFRPPSLAQPLLLSIHPHPQAEMPVLAPGKPAADAPVSTPPPAKQAGVFFQNVAKAGPAGLVIPAAESGPGAAAKVVPAKGAPAKARTAGDPANTVSTTPATIPGPEAALAGLSALLDRGLARLESSPEAAAGLKAAAAQAVAAGAGGSSSLPSPPRLPSPGDAFTSVEAAALPAAAAGAGAAGGGWMGMGGAPSGRRRRLALAAPTTAATAPHAGEGNPPLEVGLDFESIALPTGAAGDGGAAPPLEATLASMPAAPAHRPPGAGSSVLTFMSADAAPAHRPPGGEGWGNPVAVAPAHRPPAGVVNLMSSPSGVLPSHRPPSGGGTNSKLLAVTLFATAGEGGSGGGGDPGHRPPQGGASGVSDQAVIQPAP